MFKTIAKPSEIKELQIRQLDDVEAKIASGIELEIKDLPAFISKTNRELYNLRRDYDHLHAVVEKMYNGEDVE